ncbi:MAG TPA: hypothetical protein VF469_07350 [Kofleriaceae bacterium]
MIALALVAACGAARTEKEKTGEPPIIKKVAVSWGIEQHGETADVFLATTDETGKQVSYSLGNYKGICMVITPAREMNAVTGVACRTGATGTELQAVIQNGEDIVVLKLGIDPGVKQDPMAREEVTRVKVPLGAKIQVGS